MALDPKGVNPLLFAAGFDLEQIDNPQVLRNVINLAKKNTYGLVSEDADGNIVIEVDSAQSKTIDPLRDNTTPEREAQGNTGGARRSFTFDELVSVSRKYAALSSQPSKNIDSVQNLINEKSQAIQKKQSKRTALLRLEDPKQRGKIDQLNREIDELTGAIARLEGRKRSEQEALDRAMESDPDIQILRSLLTELIESYQRSTEDFPQPSRTAALLDLLSDKKAIFSNGQQPGFYRYYSSAHPLPENQGQSSINTTAGEGGSEGEPVELPSPVSKPGFLEFVCRPASDGTFPEAELGTIKVHRGIRILRSFGEEVMTTDQIQNISFARHDIDFDVGQTTYEYGSFFSGLDEKQRQAIQKRFQKGSEKAKNDGTIQDGFEVVWLKQVENWEGPVFPTRIFYNEVEIDTTATTILEFRDLAFPTLDTSNDPLAGVSEAKSLLVTILKEELYIETSAALRNLWAGVGGIDPKKDPSRV
jgi:hypothetical protein